MPRCRQRFICGHYLANYLSMKQIELWRNEQIKHQAEVIQNISAKAGVYSEDYIKSMQQFLDYVNRLILAECNLSILNQEGK